MAGHGSDEGGGWIWLVIIAGLAYWYFGTGKKPLQIETSPVVGAPLPPPQGASPPVTQPTTEPPTPAPETHNYNFAEDGAYGYVSAVSEEDRKRGVAIGDVLLFRYLGKSEGLYRIQWLNDSGQVISYYECPRQCGAIKAYAGGTMHRIPYNPQSLVGAAFEDAFLGKLRAKPIATPKPLVAEPAIEEPAQTTPSANGAAPLS